LLLNSPGVIALPAQRGTAISTAYIRKTKKTNYLSPKMHRNQPETNSYHNSLIAKEIPNTSALIMKYGAPFAELVDHLAGYVYPD
jgi:hypothetical protein